MKKLIFLLFLVSVGRPSDSFKIDGWQMDGIVLKYNPGNLWEYIDGAADQFLDFGFEELQAADLRANDLLVTVEIYNMGSSINAFGIYMIERPKDVGYLEIGTESAINMPSQALMLKDYFYLKMHLLEGNLSRENWAKFLNKLAAELPGNNNWPEELSYLPKANMIDNSIGYVRTNFLGLHELNNCIFAEYQDSGQNSYQQFIILQEGNREAINPQLGDKWQNENGIWVRKIPYQGYIGIKFDQGYINGVAQIQNRERVFELLKN